MLPDVPTLKKKKKKIHSWVLKRTLDDLRLHIHTAKDFSSLRMSPILSPPETLWVHRMDYDALPFFTSIEREHFLN